MKNKEKFEKKIKTIIFASLNFLKEITEKNLEKKKLRINFADRKRRRKLKNRKEKKRQ